MPEPKRLRMTLSPAITSLEPVKQLIASLQAAGNQCCKASETSTALC